MPPDADHIEAYRDDRVERERQRPISLKWQTNTIQGQLQQVLGTSATGAAIVAEICLSGVEQSYSRTSRHYNERTSRYRDRLYTWRRVVSTVDLLEQQGLIEHRKTVPGGRGWQSSLSPCPELITIFHDAVQPSQVKLVRPHETLVLKNRNGVLLDYSDSQQTIRRRRRVERLNEAIRGSDLDPSIAAPVVRIFTGSFNLHGRIYGMGNSWQNIPAEARKQLTINGEAVVELDFRNLHPVLLYAEAGVEPPSDCYDLPGWPRDLVKVALLILINSRLEHSARQAIAWRDAMSAITRPGSQEAHAAAQQLIDGLKRLHYPIAHAFHSDAGLRLMAKDSAIADEVVSTMLRQGILVLPVHDSFLVAASKVNLLEAAMVEAARAVAGVPLTISAT